MGRVNTIVSFTSGEEAVVLVSGSSELTADVVEATGIGAFATGAGGRFGAGTVCPITLTKRHNMKIVIRANDIIFVI